MPFIDEPLDVIGRPRASDLPEAFDPSAEAVVGAALERESVPINVLRHAMEPDYELDPEYDPMADIKDTTYEALYLDRFAGARNADHVQSIKDRIDREEKTAETIAAGGWLGVVSSMAAGVLDPTILVPAAKIVQGAQLANRVGRTSLTTAGLAAGAVGVQETALQETQETRTAEESLFNVAGAAVIGGVLGGAAGALSRSRIDQLGRKIETVPVTVAEEQAAFSQLTREASVGAAAVSRERGTGELASAFGAERALRFQDPLLRTQTSDIQATRNIVRDLAETPLTLAENAEGIATTIGGSVETRIKMSMAPLGDALPELDRLYSDYYFGRKARFAPARGEIDKLVGNNPGKMSYVQFKEAAWRAALDGDVSDIPQVAAAAKEFRKSIWDPFKDQAIANRLFPEDVKPEFDAGYVPRLYNRARIIAQRGDFSRVLVSWFRSRADDLAQQVDRLERAGQEIPEDLSTAARMSDQEIASLVEETIDNILGHSPSRMPYDFTAGPRGPLKERVLRVPTKLIEDFLEKDIEVVARTYTRTMAADINLVRAFGRTDMQDQINKIRDEANTKSNAATTEAERNRIGKQKETDIRDIEAMRDRLRGTFGIPDNPDGMLARSGRVVRNLNYLRLLGGMTLSAIPDVGRAVMVHGLSRTFRDGWLPFVTNLSKARLAAKEIKLAGTALDMVMDSRTMALADIQDDFGRASKFERGLQAVTTRFGLVSLMAPWNSAMKQVAGLVTITRALESSAALAAGKAGKKQIEALAASGIDRNMASRIAKQFEAHGRTDDGIRFANTEAWTDRQAVEALRAAIVRDVDRIVVTPGQDKPLFASKDLGKLLFQFKSFALASTQRTVLAGLQQRDMATLNGLIMMQALGAAATWAKLSSAGFPLPESPEEWAVEAFDRSGVAGWFMEANNITEKLTRGRVGLSAITGKYASRYASRNVLGSVLGPTADLIPDVAQVTSSAFAGDWKASDTHALRKLTPFQNLFYIRRLLDDVEDASNNAFGIEQRDRSRRVN